MRRAAIGCGVLALVLAATTAPCDEQKFVLELAVSDVEASTDQDADWGWWSPDKHASWGESPDDGFDLVGARLAFPGDTYTVFFATERYPELRAEAVRPGSGGGGDVLLDVAIELEVYDLVLARSFGRGPVSRFSPWLGVSYVRVDEAREFVGITADRAPDEADAGLWGACLGADAVIGMTPRLAATARLVARWADGTRDAFFLPEDTDPDDPQAGRVEQSDDVTVGIWGGELGVRWLVTDVIHLDAGWRYRDWRYDDGPARFSGPFLRLVAGL